MNTFRKKIDDYSRTFEERTIITYSRKSKRVNIRRSETLLSESLINEYLKSDSKKK